MFSIQSFRECAGYQAQCERRVISLQECVPPPCVSHASHVANLVASGSRCVDFSMCSDAEVGESARDSVPSVAGDSLSLFSPVEVFSLFSEWMPVLSCDLQGIKLHETTLAALMLVETRPFVPCCATYIFTDGSGGANLGGSSRGPPSWAFCVVQQDNDGKFYFAGALSGCVCYNEQHPAFLGACNESDNQSFTAELTALIWALVWVCQNPSEGMFQVWSDNKAALGIVSDQSSSAAQKDLAEVAGHLGATVLPRISMFGHVAGHSGQPWNELADTLCDHMSRGVLPLGCDWDRLVWRYKPPIQLVSSKLRWAPLLNNSCQLEGYPSSVWTDGSVPCVLPTPASERQHFQGVSIVYQDQERKPFVV